MGAAEDLNGHGLTCHVAGELDAAQRAYEECAAICQANGYRPTLIAALNNLGHVAVSRHDFGTARRLLGEGLTVSGEIGDRRRQAFILSAVATLAAAEGEWERAVRLDASARATLQQIGAVLAPPMRMVYDAQLTPARRALGERSAAVAEATGRAMTFEAVIEEALAWLSDSAAPDAPSEPPIQADDRPVRPTVIAASERLPAAPAGPSAPGGSRAAHPLTRRELAVAQLIAQGLTNRQIAAELVITDGTTSNYVQRVMSRLGFHSRAQIAAWVVEHGLLEPSDDEER